MLEVNNLSKNFAGTGRETEFAAVDGISFTLDAGECLGLIGESGCGKSTTARLITGLVQADAGSVLLEGAFRFILSPGKPFDLHCSAPGKAIMAYLPNTVRDRYLSYMEFTRYNARTITTRDAYLEELEKVRKLGYAMDNEEELNGVICIGAPIFNYTGYPCGAIWISGPKDRLSKEVVRVSADCIRKVAQTISLELGYSKAKKI